MKNFFTLIAALLLFSAKVAAQTRTTIVSFDGTTTIATGGVATNSAQAVSTNSGSITFTNPCTTSTCRSQGWDGGNGTKYWLIGANTTGFTALQISFTQRSSDTGPRDFKLQYSINGTTWTDVGSVQTLISNTCVKTNNLILPSGVEQQLTLQLRWIMTSNVSVNLGVVQNNGGSNITDILVTGLPANPTTTSILPTSRNEGSSGFTITVDGTNFISGLSKVTWNGSKKGTTYVSPTRLTASINSADIADYGTALVGVTTTGAVATSNTQTFTILPYGTTPPVLTSDPNATVDNPFTITFPDNASWRTAITGIKVNGTLLSPSSYTISAGQIVFTPALDALLQTTGTKTIIVKATGYSSDVVSQTINPGLPNSLVFITQPAAPATYSGLLTTQPAVVLKDQYNNPELSGFTIIASVPGTQTGNWTLGGTTSIVTNSSGIATYANLTATNLTLSAYTASIIFTYSSISITSNTFNLPPPPPVNDDCSNAISLSSGVTQTGTFVSATSSPALSYDPTSKDVWYKFVAGCTAQHTITVNFTGGLNINVDFDVFTGTCPSSGTGIYTAHVNSGSTETKSSNYTAGTTYYIRVIDDGTTSAGNFTITVSVNPPAQPSSITGLSAPCEGSSQLYSVLNGVSLTYAWTLPTGWTGSLTTNSIAVVAGSASGTITVTPTNGCGIDGPAQTLAVTPVITALDPTAANANAGNGRLSITWTNVDCFDEVMVVATDNASVTSVPSGDGSAYVASNVFASSNPDNSVGLVVGEYCIYKGTSSSVSLIGLLNTNVYKIKIFTRWGTMWSSGVQITGTPVAASTGAFRSIVSGNWTDNTTWEKFNGTSWVPTSGSGDYPNYFGSDVTVEAGMNIKLNTTPVSVHNLTVNPGGKLWTGFYDTAQLKYVSVFGDVVCDGTIGNNNPNTADNISFNIDNSSCDISGSGKFSCARIRKLFDKNDPGGSNTTNLYIDMDIVGHWPGTVLYNASTPASTYATFFNVTLNSPFTFTCKDTAGSVAIDGLKGTGFYKAAGKFTINGTLTVGGALYLSTNNANSNGVNDPCTFEIGSTGVVNTGTIVILSSGIATHTFSIKPKGLLNVTDSSGFASFIKTNNIISIQQGSTIRYSANGGQEVLCGLTYSNLTIAGTGEKIISNANNVLTVSDTLTISSGSLAIGAKTLAINGFVRGNGTLTGSAASKMLIGPSTTLTGSPLGVIKFTPGFERLNVLTLDRDMKTNVYPGHAYYAVALSSKLDVDSLNLNQGIIATGHNLLTLLRYPANAYSTLNTRSYVATTDTAATAFTVGNTFDGSYGFRISGVKANTDTWFPVGADFIAPNRVWLNLGNGASTRDMTVVLTKGDITYTGSPRVSRIWYINASPNTAVSASMKLYYNSYPITSNYLVSQDELETGFVGTRVRLVEKANLSDNFFTNISNSLSDVQFNTRNGLERYALYTPSSTVYNGTQTGISSFGIFSAVDGDNVVLPVIFTAISAYRQQGIVKINWSVTSEVNIDHYEVERAGDSRLFTLLATANAHSAGATGSSYTANDTQPLTGTNYYRVKAVGKDGAILYTTVVSVTLGSDGKAGMIVYPNPVKNDKCTVQLNNLPAGTYNIALYNMAGRQITAKMVEHPGGTTNQSIYLPAGTAAGVYLIKLSGKTINMQTSVFVNHK